MARIAIVKVLYGMTITGAQLAGELLAHGHQPKIIFFKRQALVKASEANHAEYERGDVPMQNYTISNDGSELIETSIWNKTKPQELQHLVTAIKEFQADAIGISTLSVGMTLASEITNHLRKNFNLPILWGGTGPTIEPDRSIQYADLVCVGEGEDVIIDIATRLDQKKSLENIPGTWFRTADGVVQKNPKRPVADLEKIALPNWQADHYVFINGPRFERKMVPNQHSMDKSYQIMTQRGCPFSCSFCVESFYQKEFGKTDSLRRMSPEKAIKELKVAKKELGYTSVTFMDDVFTINPRWLEKFLTLYKKEIDLPFFCYTYPTTHNPKMLALLRDAGCCAITMGVQSGSQRILNEIYDRPTKVGRVVKAAQEIVNSGIPAATFDLIPQTEFDTEEDLRETLEIMLQMPKEMDTTFYGKLAYFPNYPIQEKFHDSRITARTERLTEDDYLYYFKLFDLTRTNMPFEQVRAIANDPGYRQNHNLLNNMLNSASRVKASYGNLVDLGVQRSQQQETKGVG